MSVFALDIAAIRLIIRFMEPSDGCLIMTTSGEREGER